MSNTGELPMEGGGMRASGPAEQAGPDGSAPASAGEAGNVGQDKRGRDVTGGRAAAPKRRKGGERRKAAEARRTPEAEGATTRSERQSERRGGVSEGEGDAERRTGEAVSRNAAAPEAAQPAPGAVAAALARLKGVVDKAKAAMTAAERVAFDERMATYSHGRSAAPAVPGMNAKTHQVYVRMPHAMLSAVDKAVADSPIEFGNQSDFIRRAVETELRRRGLLPNFK